jgi:hypothetical protein
MKLIGSGLVNDRQLGNKMFQFMFCNELQKCCPEFSLHRANIPEFNLIMQERPSKGKTLTIGGGYVHDVKYLTYLLNNGIYDNILIDTLCLRLEYYLNRNEYQTIFHSDYVPDAKYLGDDHLLINVRANEVLSAVNIDYGPTPVEFFAQIIEETGLKPVFMGQLGTEFYSDAIRDRFKDALFIESQGPLRDFQTVRSAKNILVPVSTFSFLASWLAYDATNIFFPVKGFYNPKQTRGINLLPLSDPRYKFYKFPVEEWHATDEQKHDLVLSSTRYPRYQKSELLELISY